jgi:hypothetical protein
MRRRTRPATHFLPMRFGTTGDVADLVELITCCIEEPLEAKTLAQLGIDRVSILTTMNHFSNNLPRLNLTFFFLLAVLLVDLELEYSSHKLNT